MRISEWSSDVCSSDLARLEELPGRRLTIIRRRTGANARNRPRHFPPPSARRRRSPADRQRVVSGKSVSVRVDLGGRRIIKKKTTHITTHLHKRINYQIQATVATSPHTLQLIRD